MLKARQYRELHPYWYAYKGSTGIFEVRVTLRQMDNLSHCLSSLSMRLCDVCQKFNQREWKTAPGKINGETIEHHKSDDDLCRAVSQDCQLCTILRDGLLAWLARDSYDIKGDWVQNDCKEKKGISRINIHDPALSFCFQPYQGYPTIMSRPVFDQALINCLFYKLASSCEKSQSWHWAEAPHFSIWSSAGKLHRNTYINILN